MSKLPRMDAVELVQQSKPFDHADWIYEIKYDGFRGLAYVEDGTCQLVSRNDFDYSRFKELINSGRTPYSSRSAPFDFPTIAHHLRTGIPNSGV